MSFGVAAAVVGGSLISGYFQGEAAEDASNAQSASAAAGIAEQRRQFDAIRALLKPYVDAGTPALKQQQALLGLGTPAEQKAAIAGIESSPVFQSILKQGEAGILSNASATGGLRGGNVQRALAQFRPQLLAQEIENRYARLGGLTSLGQQSAVGVGNAGMSTGSNVANLLAQQGAAQAGGALAQGNAMAGALGGITQGLGTFYGLTGQSPFAGFSNPFGGGGSLGSLAGTSMVSGPGGMVPVI